jgi:hypothetical protein
MPARTILEISFDTTFVIISFYSINVYTGLCYPVQDQVNEKIVQVVYGHRTLLPCTGSKRFLRVCI